MRLDTKLLVIVLWVLSVLTVVSAKKKKKTPVEKSNTPQELTVVERNLVTKDVKSSRIIKEFKSYSNTKNHIKHFEGVTLAYVTPWHYDAYDLTTTFKHKFNLISPVWLSVRPMEHGHSLIAGLHDKREDWMKRVRKDNDNLKIVPRLNFEAWTPDDFKNVLGTEKKLNVFADHIIKVCNENKFDGMVLEMWNALAFAREGNLIHAISHIGERVRAVGKLFILVIPPSLGRSVRPLVTPEEIEELSDYVDYFSLMTYDYSGPDHPGPVAPLFWAKQCVEFIADPKKQKNPSKIRKQILMGMNFYGFSQTAGEPRGDTIMNGDVYTKMLDNFTPKFTWLEQEAEHEGKFTNDAQKEVRFWYPTLFSLQKRLDLARSLDIGGVSLWEAGQGLDYFFDLL